jgi:DNA polymerase III subunit delta
MKYSSLASFEKHLDSSAPNHFSELYFVQAKDAFIKKQALDHLTRLFLKGEPGLQAAGLQTFDAEKHTVQRVLQELETLGLFSQKRLIVLHNVDEYDKGALTKLEQYFSAPNKGMCLALSASSMNRASGFYKKTEKLGVVFDLPEEKPWEKEKSSLEWLQAAAAKEKKRMAPAVAQAMIKQLGTDLGTLHAELLKVACFVGERAEIQMQDLAAICAVVDTGTIWQLGEALFRRDAAHALSLVKGLLRQAGSAGVIGMLRQLRGQFQTEFHVCAILSMGGTAADVAQKYPYMKGQILERHVSQAQQYGQQRFKNALLAIDEAEMAAKSSSLEPEFLMELLMIKLTR